MGQQKERGSVGSKEKVIFLYFKKQTDFKSIACTVEESYYTLMVNIDTVVPRITSQLYDCGLTCQRMNGVTCHCLSEYNITMSAKVSRNDKIK